MLKRKNKQFLRKQIISICFIIMGLAAFGLAKTQYEYCAKPIIVFLSIIVLVLGALQDDQRKRANVEFSESYLKVEGDDVSLSLERFSNLISAYIHMRYFELPKRNKILTILPRIIDKYGQQYYPVMSGNTRKDFHYFLMNPSKNVVTSVLKVLRDEGLDSAIPFVLPLAKGNWSAKKHPEIKRLAEECLEQIETRIEKRKERLVLLRPTIGNNFNQLLRPSTERLSDTQTLLRPSAEETDAKPESPDHSDQ